MQGGAAVALIGIAALGVACAKSTTSPIAPRTQAVTSASPSQSPAPTQTASAPAGVEVVRSGTATVSGKSQTVLTNDRGLTLYEHSTDPGSLCTGQCAAAWPPLLLASGNPTSAVAIPGALGVQANANGRQVTYGGHPLYGWQNDTSPGQATGEGINNFHAVTLVMAGP